MINKNHPHDVGLTYFQHMKFAWRESIQSLWISLVMLVHGIIPWIWDWKYSAYIEGAKKRIDPQHEIRRKNYGKD